MTIVSHNHSSTILAEISLQNISNIGEEQSLDEVLPEEQLVNPESTNDLSEETGSLTTPAKYYCFTPETTDFSSKQMQHYLSTKHPLKNQSNPELAADKSSLPIQKQSSIEKKIFKQATSSLREGQPKEKLTETQTTFSKANRMVQQSLTRFHPLPSKMLYSQTTQLHSNNVLTKTKPPVSEKKTNTLTTQKKQQAEAKQNAKGLSTAPPTIITTHPYHPSGQTARAERKKRSAATRAESPGKRRASRKNSKNSQDD